MADEDGKNRYPNDDIWLTDGYGDYVRHYLRAMAAAPELAPADQDHVLGSSSVIKSIRYSPGEVVYETFDLDSTETLRLSFTPSTVTLGSERLPKLATRRDLDSHEGYVTEGGALRVHHYSAARPVRIARSE
jgi:hypothetical protein